MREFLARFSEMTEKQQTALRLSTWSENVIDFPLKKESISGRKVFREHFSNVALVGVGVGVKNRELEKRFLSHINDKSMP